MVSKIQTDFQYYKDKTINLKLKHLMLSIQFLIDWYNRQLINKIQVWRKNEKINYAYVSSTESCNNGFIHHFT
jgi:phosphatidate phosphatase PAH1